MRLNFGNIEIEGFRSIVNCLVFNLNRIGLNMVKGLNGAGKTTLFEALIWCLYGANLKGTVSAKVQSWKEVRSKDYKGTHVAVDIYAGPDIYQIVRTIKYMDVGDVLHVYKNGDQIQELDKADTQEYINNLLTMNYNTFMNSFMFGQRMTRLVESENKDKRKLFEDLFDMDWIQEMRDKVSKDYNETESEWSDIGHALETKKLSIEFHKEKVEDAQIRLDLEQDEERRKASERAGQVVKCQEYITIKKTEKDKLNAALKVLPTPVEIEDYSERLVTVEGRLKLIDAEIESWEARKNTLQGGLMSKEEALADFSDQKYKDYLSNVSRVAIEIKDCVGQLFDESSDLLTDEEIIAIQGDYETALSNKTIAKNNLLDLTGKLTAMEEDAVCPTCNRPFDTDDDFEAHMKKLKQQQQILEIVDEGAELALSTARADANVLQTYQELLHTVNVMESNAPNDPKVEKEKLQNDLVELGERIKEFDVSIRESDTKALDLEGTISILKEQQKEGETVRLENIKLGYERSGIEDELHDVTRDIDDVEQEIERWKMSPEYSKVPGLEAQLSKTQDDCLRTQGELEKLQKVSDELDDRLQMLKFWLKDVFAANGLKAYIFKAMLDDLNQYTSKYGTKLGCSMRFSLDLTKTSAPFSTICSLGDKINKDYKEFSGGERQRLDIVLMFSMHDLLSSNTELNLLIMDEVFEGLDEQGESDVFELIREKSEGRSVYVISHSPVLDTLHSKTIKVCSHNGKTEIDG